MGANAFPGPLAQIVLSLWPGIGSMHSPESLAGLLTRVLTGNASIYSGGYGRRSGCKRSASCWEGSSHTSYSAGERITGLRTCRGRTKSFATVVMTVQESSGWPSDGTHRSQSPANAKGRPSWRRM